MQFYMTRIFTYNDGTKQASSIGTYDDLNSALATFHSQLSKAYTNTDGNIATGLCYIVNSDGAMLKSEKYVNDTVVEETSDEDESATE